MRESLLSRVLPGAAALRSRGSLDLGSRAVAHATFVLRPSCRSSSFPVAFVLGRSRRIASIFCRAGHVHIVCCAGLIRIFCCAGLLHMFCCAGLVHWVARAGRCVACAAWARGACWRCPRRVASSRRRATKPALQDVLCSPFQRAASLENGSKGSVLLERFDKRGERI